jgi:uncharacterized repeat protein (TIGR01451 family)
MPRIVALAVLTVGIVAGGSDPALARKTAKPDPCPPARYLIASGPIAADGGGAALQLGPSTAIDGVCDAIAPRRMQVNRKGITQVMVRWKRCTGLTGAVVLQGKIVPGCSQFQGTLKAKKLKKKLDAARSTCGDGIIDTGGGEQCDDGNTAAGDGCEPDCSPTPPVTTTTAPAATSTTSTIVSPSSTSTTVVRGGSTTSTITVSSTSTTSTTLPKTVLTIGLVANPDPVAPGGLLTYDVTVTNHGPVEAVQVQLRLPIPTGAGSCVSLSDGGQLPTGCFVTRDMVWTLDRLPVGASRTVEAVLTAAGNLASGSSIAATARADDAAGSPQAVAQTTSLVVPASPLTLGLTQDEDPVQVGDQLEYVVRFGNRGAAALLGSQLVVTLAAGTTVVDDGGGTQGTGTVTWSLGALNPGQTGERRLRVSIDDLAPDDPLVRVTAAAITSGATAARASTVVQVQPVAPLGLAMSVTPEPVDPSQRITYQLTVTNRGATDSADVKLSMPIPEGVTGGCVRLSDDAQTPAGCFNGREIQWALGTLPAGTSRTVEAIFDPASLADGAVFSAVARVVDAAGSRARATASSTFHTTAAAALMVGLTASADPVLVQDELEYVVRYGNRGAAALLGAQLVVTLPPGTSVLDDGGGTEDGDAVTWSLGALNVGQTGERRLRVRVDAADPHDPLVRIAQAALTSGAVAARASVVTQVEPVTPLALIMAVNPEPADTTQVLIYQLLVTNRGAVDATGVQLRMPIPDGVTGCARLSDDAQTPDGCFTGRDVLWTLGTLAAGTSRTVQVIYDLGNVADGAILTATAAVSDTLGSSARAAASTTFHTLAAGASAPLMIALTENANPVPVGDELRYSIRFGNRGTAALLSAQLAVALPAGLTVVDAGGGTSTSDGVTWNLGTLDPGETGERLLRTSVVHVDGDPLIRATRASITTNAASAIASAVTMVQPSRLGLVIVANPDPVAPGQFVTYELTVTNHGPDDAVQVKVTMPIPGGLTGGCVRLSDDAATPGGCFTGRDVVWTLDTLPAGTSRTVQASFDAVTSLADGTILPAAASVVDAAGSRARADVSTIFHATAASPLVLALAKSADPVLVGDELAYDVRFGNESAAAVLNAQLTLTLPPGATALDLDGGTKTGDTVSWSLGTLDAGETGAHVVRVRIDDAGTADPLVRLARATLTGGAAAASASVLALVEPATPLALDMSTDVDPAKPNQLVTYQLKVTNNGADDSVQVQLRMPIPNGISGCGTLSDGGTLPSGCFAGRDALWELGTLSPGATRSVTFVLRVRNTAPAGSVVAATSRVEDAAGSRARAALSTPVEP